MPELPEVETMRRGVLSIVGGRIVDVSRPPCACRPIEIRPALAELRRRVLGRTVVGVSRAGKRVVVELNSGDGIVFEPRMTGLVLLAQPPDQGHLRLRIAVKIDESHSPAELLYWDRRGLGSVRLFSPAELERKLGIKNLGPDALAISCGTLRQRLGRSRRAIKVALLDQHAVAGIGNLYSAEILHLARIHPLRRCCDLRPKQWRDLHAAMRRVLHAAIQAEGSTLSDGTYRNALNQAGQYQNHHRVYDQAGEKCGRCGRGTILRIVQAQRATFFCPVCQRLTAARR